MMTFKDAINELTEETVIEVNSKTKEFVRATKASEALSLAYTALGSRLQRALDEGSRHRSEPKDEQNSLALNNNDARAAFVAHNRAEQAMNAPISLHLPNSTR